MQSHFRFRPKRLFCSNVTPNTPNVKINNKIDGKLAIADTERLFAQKSTLELFAAATLFSAISHPSLAKPGVLTLSWAMRPVPFGSNNWVQTQIIRAAKRTLFVYFCAGERVEDCEAVAKRTPFARLIVDHSVEERVLPEDLGVNLQRKCALLQTLQQSLGDRVSFMPVKVTALVPPALLETLATLISSSQSHSDRHQTSEEAMTDVFPLLSPTDQEALRKAEHTLQQLCQQAAASNIPLLLDAEQSYRQPAIDYLALRLMRRFNTERPVVFNTFQMYLRGALSRLERDLRVAESQGFVLAVKVVRGAYKQAEELRASKHNLPSPLVASKRDADEQYNQALTLLLQRVATSKGRPSVAMVIATHNVPSVLHAAKLMGELGVAHNQQEVQFAQIKGMCENLTSALGQAGFNSNQLVLFGDFLDIFPWLLRRVEENSDLLSAMAEQKHSLWAELKRRLTPRMWRKASQHKG